MVNELFQGTRPGGALCHGPLPGGLLEPWQSSGSASDLGVLCSSGHADKPLFALCLPGHLGLGPSRKALTSKHLGVLVTGMGNGLTKGLGHFCLTREEPATVVSDVKFKAVEVIPSSSPSFSGALKINCL